MTAGFARFATLERCRTCFALMPTEGPRICSKCSTVKVTPRWSDWSHALRVFLILRYGERHLFPSWRPMQDSWELLLSGNYEGKRGVNGQLTRQGVTADEVYAQAVTDAEEWQASGSKTAFL